MLAASNGHVETVKVLLGAEDIDVNAKDGDLGDGYCVGHVVVAAHSVGGMR